MIKYLLWDFDGVICDSKEIAFKVHNEIAKKYEKLPLILNEQDYSKMMNNPIIIDGRNCFDLKDIPEDVIYESIGRKTINNNISII